MNRPGCFGIAICYSTASPVCKRCKSAPECCTEAESDLVKLGQDLDVTHLLKAVRKGKTTVSDQFITQINNLPVKARPIYERMVRMGVDAQAELRAGSNPFLLCGPKFMKVAGELLVLHRGFDRATLKRYMTEANPQWSTRTVDSQVSIACGLLIGLNLAVEVDGHLRMAE